MALTQIARKLKQAFPENEPQLSAEEIQERKRKYGQNVEFIHIGGMDYVVIDGEYTDNRIGKINFSESIKDACGIIDIKTSSTLIDEVYSRVAYLQKDCTCAPDDIDWEALATEIRESVGEFVDEEELELGETSINTSDKDNTISIFQCHILKDMGVSASNDTYAFMLKGKKPQTINKDIIRQLGGTGNVSELKDQSVLKEKNDAIQQTIFDEFSNVDVDISSITVKSIFEILTNVYEASVNIHEREGKAPKMAALKVTYLASNARNAFKSLNHSIHKCNTCGTELANENLHIHINMDALISADSEDAYATGCEKCLEQCPKCGGWHFNYEKNRLTKSAYKDVIFSDGGKRKAVCYMRRLDENINYCSCCEGIDWAYDERIPLGSDNGVIPIRQICFVNYSNEVLAGYKEYDDYRREKGKTNQNCLDEFKRHIASKNNMKASDIFIANAEKCKKCGACGGIYYMENSKQDFYCPTCGEMIETGKHMATRSDGVIFLRRRGGSDSIQKYIMTGLGFLKKVKVAQVEIKHDEPAEGTAETDN